MSSAVIRPGCATPTASVTLTISLRKVRMYCAQRSPFETGSRPWTSQGFWVATPVGQWSVWHFCDWMQPIDIIASRATLTMSAPSAKATLGVVGEAELAGADEGDVVGQAGLGEGAVDPGEAHPERQRDRVGEDRRGGAGAALAAVDGDEVDAAVAAGHQPGELEPEAASPPRPT